VENFPPSEKVMEIGKSSRQVPATKRRIQLEARKLKKSSFFHQAPQNESHQCLPRIS
jgi:hypothetical protein